MGTLRRVPWDRLARGGRALVFCGLLMLGVAGMLSRWGDVFADKDIYFLDPDCYSRMTRAALVLRGEGPSVRFHAFENAPDGIRTHTTAPLDWLIVAGSLFLPSLDLAGAWISPALGGIFLALVAGWARRRKFGGAALAVLCFSPVVAHGFSIGRPDHQSLLMLLTGVALAAEWALWEEWHPRRMAWVSATAWALALWTSLFEPLILLAACLLLRSMVLGKRALQDAGRPTVGFGLLLGAIILVDGLRLPANNPEVRTFFARWATSIGELRPAGWSGICGWLGWLAPIAPALLFWQGWRRRSRQACALAILCALLLGLTFWTARWGYFLALAYALALPVILGRFRHAWMAWTVFVISLWPVAAAWERDLFPEGEARARQQETRMENVLLRSLVPAIQSLPEGPLVAPWWLSPALAYWTGRPFVAGSSHESLPGIVFTARFYTETSPEKARQILSERRVIGVVSDDPRRILDTSRSLLGIGPPPPGTLTVAERLQHGRPFLQKISENQFFRLFSTENPQKNE